MWRERKRERKMGKVLFFAFSAVAFNMIILAVVFNMIILLATLHVKVFKAMSKESCRS